MQRRLIWWLVSRKLERMWKEAVMPQLEALTPHLPEGSEENYEAWVRLTGHWVDFEPQNSWGRFERTVVILLWSVRTVLFDTTPRVQVDSHRFYPEHEESRFVRNMYQTTRRQIPENRNPQAMTQVPQNIRIGQKIISHHKHILGSLFSRLIKQFTFNCTANAHFSPLTRQKLRGLS